MIAVVDASALIIGLLGSGTRSHDLRQRLVWDATHAPHLIDAEIGNVLRRRVLRRELTAVEARELLADAAPLIDYRHAMTGALAQAAWALRETVSFYDALYVALAQSLRCPLLTADLRLARAAQALCAVESVASD